VEPELGERRRERVDRVGGVADVGEGDALERPACSRIVNASLIDWQGCLSWSIPLMTGTVDQAASSFTVSFFLERISMAELYWASVRAVSAMLSRPGRWISPGRR
jgi:hypothetical protein